MLLIQNNYGDPVKLKLEDLKGRSVQLSAPIQTGVVSLPIGWVGTVTAIWRGKLCLKGVSCAHCGVSVLVRQIPLSAVVLVEEIPF